MPSPQGAAKFPANSWPRPFGSTSSPSLASSQTKLKGDGFEVLMNPNADGQPAHKRENKLVRFDADTIFQSSEKRDLKVGREVQTVGLDLRNGIVKATRVTVYEGKHPVRMKRAK
jgi:hypothetical protein